MDLAVPFFDFTSTGTSHSRVRTKKSCSSVESYFL